MIILILIILIFFNIYLKSIKSSFYTILTLFVLIINEIYFSKIEKFDGKTTPNKTTHSLITDFEDIPYQMCLFIEQEKKLEENSEITKCYKIFNNNSCDKDPDCEYDIEFNRCVDKTNCKKRPLKCQNIINTECESLLYNEDKCLKMGDKHCKDDSECELDYYSDIYNIEKNTNMKVCHTTEILNSDTLDNSLTKEEITTEKLHDEINTILKENPNISYYGIQKIDEKYKLYFFNLDTLDEISYSSTLPIYCLNENKFVGNGDYITIYERESQCKTSKKCEWDDTHKACYNVVHTKGYEDFIAKLRCAVQPSVCEIPTMPEDGQVGDYTLMITMTAEMAPPVPETLSDSSYTTPSVPGTLSDSSYTTPSVPETLSESSYTTPSVPETLSESSYTTPSVPETLSRSRVFYLRVNVKTGETPNINTTELTLDLITKLNNGNEITINNLNSGNHEVTINNFKFTKKQNTLTLITGSYKYLIKSIDIKRVEHLAVW